MRRTLFILLVSCLSVSPLVAWAKVNIFACEPEWAALAEQLGGDRVDVFAATHAKQNPHYIRARPSLIAKARIADLLFCSGASLEVGWLPILLKKAGSSVQAGAIGYLMAADVVPLLEQAKVLDRSMGDIHPEGNPHVHLNPHNILKLAGELHQRLTQIDAGHADFYHARYQAFATRWQEAIVQWERAAAQFRGVSVVVHHRSFSYLLDWLGMREIASLEPRPGIPPTIPHLQGLLQRLKDTPATMILRTPYDADGGSKWLAARTAIPELVLPYTVGGDDQSNGLFELFEHTLFLLRQAYGER